jgi:hypothetical protein
MLLCYDGSAEAAHAIDVAATLLAPRWAVVVDVAPLLTPAQHVATIASVVPGAAGLYGQPVPGAGASMTRTCPVLALMTSSTAPVPRQSAVSMNSV